MGTPDKKTNVVEIQTPTEAAKVQRRQVYEAVEAAYNDQRKCYKSSLNGIFSDAAIAAKIGCSEGVVEKVREEFFGPAEKSEPVEDIDAVRRELANLVLDTQKLEAEAKGIEAQAKELRLRTVRADDRLRALCKEFGWAG